MYMSANLPLTPEAFNKITHEIYKKNLELLDQKRRSEKLLYSVAEAIIAVDKKLNITIFNRVSERMMGKRAEEVLGKNLDDVIVLSTEDGTKFPTKKLCFMPGKDEVIVDKLILSGRFKNYYVNAKASVIQQSNNQDECLITLTDVTKERELDKAKDDFISVASHELRTPMTIIKSYLWMLENAKAGELNQKQLEYLEKAVKSTENMINLINDMLNISRVEQGKLTFKIKKINISEDVRDSLVGFDLKASEKNLTLDVDMGGNGAGLEVYADADKVREVITNLVGNSLKFTKKGGVKVRVEDLRDCVKVSVEDTGVGISPENIQRLFQKFERLDSSYTTVAESAGTGLGLYIVKMYIENMGGQVGVDSEGIGKGSTFWFTLPKNPPKGTLEGETVSTVLK